MSVVVIGGGPAGSAAAIRLARAGIAVRLYEKQRDAHHKVCGEFVSGEALLELRELGLDVHALGALPLRTVGLAAASRERPAISALPFPAVSLSRHVLDEALLCEAARAGADVVRGKTVRMEAPEAASARALFVATGKHDLPGHPRPAGQQPDLIGFKMYYRAPEPAAARVDLIPFAGGYAGLQPVQDALNLCLLVHRDTFAAHRDFDALVSHCSSSRRISRRRYTAPSRSFPRPWRSRAFPMASCDRARNEPFGSVTKRR